MILAAVLLIAAVLLFGSSAVIGAAGLLLGFLVACAALGAAAIATGIDPAAIVLVWALAIGIAGGVAEYHRKRSAAERPLDKRE